MHSLSFIGKILMTKSLALSKFVHLVSVIQIPYKYNKFGRFIGNFGILTGKWLSKFWSEDGGFISPKFKKSHSN